MSPKRATSFDSQFCEFSIFTRLRYARPSCCHQPPYRGFSNTSGEVIGTPSFEGGTQSSSINSFLRRLQGHSLAKAPPLSQTRARLAREEQPASPAARSRASISRVAMLPRSFGTSVGICRLTTRSHVEFLQR